MHKNLIGDKYEKLTLIKYLPDRNYLCRCECGNSTVVSIGNWKRTKSCGCLRHIGYSTTHGRASHKEYNKLYHTWGGMKYRCFNKNSKDYLHYGARGITVCDEWKNNYLAFEEWALKNGYEPNLTIDRINPNGNYEPNNCRWISIAEQNRNKTTNKPFICIETNEVFKTTTEAAKRFNALPSNIHAVLNHYYGCKSAKGKHFIYMEELNNGKTF